MSDRFEIAVAGVKAIEGVQDILRRLWVAQEGGYNIAAAFCPEPHNRFDPNAIAVLIGADQGDPEGRDYGPDHVGYVPRLLAKQLAPRLRKGETITPVDVRIVRGGEPGEPVTYGARVLVDVGEPAPVASPEERGGF